MQQLMNPTIYRQLDEWSWQKQGENDCLQTQLNRSVFAAVTSTTYNLIDEEYWKGRRGLGLLYDVATVALQQFLDKEVIPFHNDP